jgi:hypothetical protein
VTLGVYDALGRTVATLVSADRPAGTYEAHFDGGSLVGGVYFCRLTAGQFRDTRQLLRVR